MTNRGHATPTAATPKRGMQSNFDDNWVASHYPDDDARSTVSSLPSSDDDSEISAPSVVERIEELILCSFLDPLWAGIDSGSSASIRRNSSNHHNDDDDDVRIVPHIDAEDRKLSFYHNQQSRTMTSIILVASFCHQLLSSTSRRDRRSDDQIPLRGGESWGDDASTGRPQASSSSIGPRTTTTREVYYHFVTHFRNQRECDRAIWDLATILNVPRQSLGLVASPKGWFCGSLSLYNRDTGGLMWNGRELDIHGMPITASTYNSTQALAGIRIESDAKCILVVEKEGVYTRLSEDKFFLNYYPSILVTGKGFPDVATRRWVQRLQNLLQIPAFGLCDCNPYGVSVLHTYQYDDQQGGGGGRQTTASVGSSRNRQRLQLQWIGLRPSQVEEMDLPPTVFQQVSELDKRQLKSLLHESHPFHQSGWNREQRVEELERMHEYKVELEALNWKGMDFLCGFIHRTIQAHERFQQESSGRAHHLEGSSDGEESRGEISPFII